MYKVIASTYSHSAAVSFGMGEFGIVPMSGSVLSSGEEDRVVTPLQMELLFENGLGDDVVYLVGKDVEAWGRSPEKPHFLKRNFIEEYAQKLTVEELRKPVYSEQVAFEPVDDALEERERRITDAFTNAVLANFLLLPELKENRTVKGYDGKPIGTSDLFLETCLCAWLDRVGDRYVYKMAMSGSYESDAGKYKRQLMKEAIDVTFESEIVPEIIHAGLVRKASFRYMELMLNVSRMLSERGVLDERAMGKLNEIKYENMTVLQKLSTLTGGAELNGYLQRTLEESNPTLGIILGNTFCCEKDAAYDLLKDTLRSLIDGRAEVESINPRVASIEVRLGKSTKSKHLKAASTGSGWVSMGYDSPRAKERSKTVKIVDGVTVIERKRDGSFSRKPEPEELLYYTKPACTHCIETQPAVQVMRAALKQSYAAGEFDVVEAGAVLPFDDESDVDYVVTPEKARVKCDSGSLSSSLVSSFDMSNTDVVFELPSPVSVTSFPFSLSESPLDSPASLIRSIKKYREFHLKVRERIVYSNLSSTAAFSSEPVRRRLFESDTSTPNTPGTPKRSSTKSDKYLSPSFTPGNSRIRSRVEIASGEMDETVKSLFTD